MGGFAGEQDNWLGIEIIVFLDLDVDTTFGR